MNPYKPIHKCSDSSNNFEFGNLLVLSYVAFQIGFFKPIGDMHQYLKGQGLQYNHYEGLDNCTITVKYTISLHKMGSTLHQESF